MSRNDVISDPYPLKLDYIPKKILDREKEKAVVTNAFSDITGDSSRNLYLHGPRGSGKTLLSRRLIEKLPSSLNSCYVPCSKFDTEYKALRRIYKSVTNQDVGTGHHKSELQIEIENRTSAINTVIVLDEIDFLLEHDDEGLFYYLSRTNSDRISVVAISSNQADPETRFEERTYSSLLPETVSFEPYTGEQTYEILLGRAKKSLQAQSLHREALTYIASSTQNVSLGLTWLKKAALETSDAITEEVVRKVKEQMYQSYVDIQLDDFSDHHRLLYNAIEDLSSSKDEVIHSGEIYDKYTEICHSGEVDVLTHRRVSDLLKDLEILGLIEANYHYGGSKGKTREVKLRFP